jgi:hypothetical protein
MDKVVMGTHYEREDAHVRTGKFSAKMQCVDACAAGKKGWKVRACVCSDEANMYVFHFEKSIAESRNTKWTCLCTNGE